MLIVHGGFHKTGSTSLQQILRAGLIPDVRYFRDSHMAVDGEHFNLELLTEAVRASTKGPVVISSEGTFGRMTDMYRSASARGLELSAALRGVDYRVVVFVRPVHSWLESSFVQLIQQGESPVEDSFFDRLGGPDSVGWHGVLEDLEAAFGPDRLIVLPYRSGVDVVQLFARACNFELPAAGVRVANRSIPPTQAALMGLANTRLDPHQSKYLRSVLKNQRVDRLDLFPTSPFSPDNQIRLLERSRIDWSEVWRHWGDEEFSSVHTFSSGDRPLPQADLSGIEPAMVSAISDVLVALVTDGERVRSSSLRARVKRIPVVGSGLAWLSQKVRQLCVERRGNLTLPKRTISE